MFLSAPLVIFFAAVGTVVSVDTETYKKGGKAVLSPGSVSEPITSVTWKHGADIAVERYAEELHQYRDFKGRCEVDTTTGALTISNLRLKDSGSYTAEINNRIMKTTEIRVITAVPKPTISTHCNPEVTQCTLTCEASATEDTRDVSYSWMIGDRHQYESSSNQLNITKDNTEFVGKLISCQLENPVSSERSDDIMSPFTNGLSVGVIIAAVVSSLLIVLLIVAALVGFLCWHKRRSGNAHDKRSRTTQNTNGAVTGVRYQKVSTQDQQGPVPQDNNNEAEMPNNTSEIQTDPGATSPENQTVTNQDQQEPVSTTSTLKIVNETGSDQTPAEPTEPSSETTTNPENQSVTNQHQAEPVLKDTNNGAEMPNNTSERLNDPRSDQTPAEPTEPSSETKTSAVALNAEEPPDQHAQQEDETREQ